MNIMYKGLKSGITSAKGFLTAGVHCGIKQKNKDLALIYSTVPAVAAATFTTSKVQAAPVIVSKKQLAKSSHMRAIIINSGNANACTGEKGIRDAWKMVKHTAWVLDIEEHEILVSSTGVIGKYLPVENILAGINEAAQKLSESSGHLSAEAIGTTDKFTKEFALQFYIGDKLVNVGGMAKGSGMIAPNMATMLAFITTDVNIAPKLLQHSLKNAVDKSFNRISVDGDTSTNDMVVVLANGLAGNSEIFNLEDKNYEVFYKALERVLIKLSKMIVLDGEGATKFIEVKIEGASTEESAVKAAKTVSNSNLVKTAIHGEDANWGRILAAIGYSGIEFDPAVVEIYFGKLPILKKNYKINFSEKMAKKILVNNEIKITVKLNQGGCSATFWTCDLSKEYVNINANYRT
jgi:glutamate N-acetyltransferase/amino-acid N-acetyltransferase